MRAIQTLSITVTITLKLTLTMLTLILFITQPLPYILASRTGTCASDTVLDDGGYSATGRGSLSASTTERCPDDRTHGK